MTSFLPPQSVPVGVIVEPTAFWCPSHLIAFKAEWPKGYMRASLALFEEAIRLPEIIAATGGQSAMLDRVLREFGPICCLVPEETVLGWTVLALEASDDVFREAIDEMRAET